MSNYKKVKVAEAKKYSPVALVTAHGDSWLTYGSCYLDAQTNIALRGSTHDRYESMLMGLMERGVIGRA